MTKEAHQETKAMKLRLSEIDADLEKTERLFNGSRSKAFRVGINRLRYALIMERHSLTHPRVEV